MVEDLQTKVQEQAEVEEIVNQSRKLREERKDSD